MAFRVSGEKLRAAREKAGLTQATVDRKLELSASYVSRLESGLTNVTVDTVYRLASLFDCQVNDLVVEVDEEGAADDKA